MSDEVARALVRRVWNELGRDQRELDALGPLPEAPLPARTDVSSLAVAAVAAASLAAAGGRGGVGIPHSSAGLRVDGARVAAAFTSERGFRLDGRPPSVWAPWSGFWRAGDGWVRTHGNYPHHAAVLRTVLGVDADADSDTIGRAIAQRDPHALAAEVEARGGLCVVVRPEDGVVDAGWRRLPLVDVGDDPVTVAPRHPADLGAPVLHGCRVLDLTRVIAGPVSTRTLALLGADVLRVDPPHPPEPEWQHFDTGPGKRSTLLDLARADDRTTFEDLAAEADAIVLGYRPEAMRRLGLDADGLRSRHPNLLVAELSAWGFDGPAAERRGFDSLVQAESGIAIIEGEGERPGSLPAQALDHATGYLLAAAVATHLTGAGRGNGRIRMSLRRAAAELLGIPRTAQPTPAQSLSSDQRAAAARTFSTPLGELELTAPALVGPSGLAEWSAGPHRWGVDLAEWIPRDVAARPPGR